MEERIVTDEELPEEDAPEFNVVSAASNLVQDDNSTEQDDEEIQEYSESKRGTHVESKSGNADDERERR